MFSQRGECLGESVLYTWGTDQLYTDLRFPCALAMPGMDMSSSWGTQRGLYVNPMWVGKEIFS